MKLSRFLTVFAVSAALVLPGCNKNKGERLDYYKVTWYNWDGEILEIDDRVLENTTPHYDGETPTRPDDSQYSYTFDKWTPDIAPVHRDQEYTATYTSELLTYTIDFELNGGTSASYEGPKQVASFNEAKELFFFDCVKPGWNFRGWSFKGVKIYDEKGILLANPEMERNMTFTAIFSQTVKLTIFSNNTAGGTYIGDGEYPYNTDVSVVATENEGYAFVGWYSNNELVSANKEYNFRMWSEDFTLEVRFEPKSYKLEIESNNASNGLVLLQDGILDHYVAEYETYYQFTKQATIVALSSNDTRFLGWFTEDNQLMDTNAVYKFVMPMEDCHLIAKWNYFTVTYKMNGGTNDSRNITEYTLETDPETLHLYTPTKGGSSFLGWSYNNPATGEEEYVTEINPQWMDNIELVAVWAADKHTLTINTVNGSCGIATYSGTGYSDEVMRAIATVNNDSVFLGWFANNVKITSNLTYTFSMPHNDYTLTAEFQTKEKLGITITSDSSNYYYGLYPQKKITGTTATTLNSVKENSTMESNGCYIYNGNYYYQRNTTWYLCDKIAWRSLKSSGNDRLLLADMLVDACAYGTNNTYKDCAQHRYLNSDFYSLAFALNSSKIAITTVDNSVSTTSTTTRYCDNTNDKIYPLSYVDYKSNSLGFESGTAASTTRKAKATDFAKDKVSSDKYDSNSYGAYLTRSPAANTYYVSLISITGQITEGSVSTTYFIRPAMHVNL